MVTEAHRLRSAYEANREFGGALPAGATTAELEHLRAAFLPRHLPEEYIDLLSVMNGTGSEWIMLADIGPLLSCDQVVAETERRSDRGGLPWCPAWSVISSEGWTFAALFTGSAPVATSPVVDLDYGNQDLPIAAASLTAMVSASADAWERGWYDASQLHPTWWHEVYAPLTRAADLRYPNTGGLATGDKVSTDAAAWPASWPREPNTMELTHVRTALAALGDGRSDLCSVVVKDRRGQILVVTDDSAEERVYLPPAFDAQGRIQQGTRVDLLLKRRSLPVTRPVELGTLECRGVVPALT